MEDQNILLRSITKISDFKNPSKCIYVRGQTDRALKIEQLSCFVHFHWTTRRPPSSSIKVAALRKLLKTELDTAVYFDLIVLGQRISDQQG